MRFYTLQALGVASVVILVQVSYSKLYYSITKIRVASANLDSQKYTPTHKHTHTQTNQNVVPATRTHSDGVSCPVFRCLHCYTFASLPAGPSSTGEGTSDEERPTSLCCACMPTCVCMLGVCFCTFCGHACYKCYD